ncbi:unnamed protein product [Plutella xylostella]|uniref:(diamondback moth) hypothetical protein n=1 Tax=Plutella xylostella TaxID=51655 RepID=A0A8S4F5L9_PLUXY|nr:unnamed protein product [Plutella xylostella]
MKNEALTLNVVPLGRARSFVEEAGGVSLQQAVVGHQLVHVQVGLALVVEVIGERGRGEEGKD